MKTKIRPDDLCRYALDAAGGGYCYGASGEVCSPDRRAQWAQWNPSQAHNLLGICQKWDGRRVWDCSGLFRGAWRALASYRSGGATTIYREWGSEKGPLDTMPDVPGIAVLRGSEKNMAHIGLYVGGGMVVDARGSSKGVLHGTLASYPAGWTHWLRLEDVAYECAGQPRPGGQRARVSGVTIGLNLRTSPHNAQNTIRLIPDGALVEILGRSGGFARVRYLDTEGYASIQYLAPLGDDAT